MLVGYGRVSKLDQNPELQLDALKAAGCEKMFIEKVSGVARDRPQLAAALSYMREGDTLVAWKLDRMARSLKELIDTAETLQQRGIGLRLLTEAIDTSTAAGKLMYHVVGAIAEFERSLMIERTRAGLSAAAARGRKGGRPPKLTDNDLRAAQAMLADTDIPVAEVARRMKVSPATLYRYLPAPRSRES